MTFWVKIIAKKKRRRNAKSKPRNDLMHSKRWNKWCRGREENEDEEEEADDEEEYNITALREKEKAMNMNGYFGYQPI